MSRKQGRKHRAPERTAPGPSVAAVPAAADGGEARPAPRALWIAALLLIVSGYSLLHKADPAGQNAWAVVSPALLLAGYLLIIPAIALTYRR